MKLNIANRNTALALGRELNGTVKSVDRANSRTGFIISISASPDKFWGEIYPILDENEQLAILRRNIQGVVV